MYNPPKEFKLDDCGDDVEEYDKIDGDNKGGQGRCDGRLMGIFIVIEDFFSVPSRQSSFIREILILIFII